MLNTLSRSRPWYYPLIAWLERFQGRRSPVQVSRVNAAERLFAIPEEDAHLYARAADEVFYQERIVTDYQRLPPVRMREYRW